MHELIDRTHCAACLSKEHNLGPIELRSTGLSPEYNVMKEGALIGTVSIFTVEDEEEKVQVHIGKYLPC
ncbi:MAG: hypothetical protein DI538_00205 [Azospira oryzae]|nr:MAG: hypothetical protein DI538_00205 [Azospira oryzae]